jgi:hypothetical protein
MLIPDPDFFFHLGSRIQQQKKREEINLLPYLYLVFVAINFTQKKIIKLSEIWVYDSVAKKFPVLNKMGRN